MRGRIGTKRRASDDISMGCAQDEERKEKKEEKEEKEERRGREG
jgi:hypothetical protein